MRFKNLLRFHFPWKKEFHHIWFRINEYELTVDYVVIFGDVMSHQPKQPPPPPRKKTKQRRTVIKTLNVKKNKKSPVHISLLNLTRK